MVSPVTLAAFVAPSAIQLGHDGFRPRGSPDALFSRGRWADFSGCQLVSYSSKHRFGLASGVGPSLPPVLARTPPLSRQSQAGGSAAEAGASPAPAAPAAPSQERPRRPLGPTAHPVRTGRVRYPAPDGGRLIAIGDVHGDFEALRQALDAAGLLTPDGHWGGGDAVLVQTGDVLDGWGEEREALSLLFRLQDEAPAQGGAVFLLAGSHELHCVTRCASDFAGRALNFKQPLADAPPGWPAWDETGLWSAVDADARWLLSRRRLRRQRERNYNSNYYYARQLGSEEAYRRAAFSVGSPLRAQLCRRLKTTVVIGDVAFVHAHVSVDLLAAAAAAVAAPAAAGDQDGGVGRDDDVEPCGQRPWPDVPPRDARATAIAGATALNRALYDALRGRKLAPPLYRQLDRALGESVWSVPPRASISKGRSKGAQDPGVVLDDLAASVLVVGHTPQELGITPRYNSRVWCLDTAMSRGVHGGDTRDYFAPTPQVAEFRFDGRRLATRDGVRVLVVPATDDRQRLRRGVPTTGARVLALPAADDRKGSRWVSPPDRPVRPRFGEVRDEE